jgi:hypothetical protein
MKKKNRKQKEEEEEGVVGMVVVVVRLDSGREVWAGAQVGSELRWVQSR